MDLLKELFDSSPYQNFPLSHYQKDLQGWHSDAPVFKKLIKAQKPNFIVEVGTWKGGSAINMGGILAQEGLTAQILCVDTWLGALEFWENKEDNNRYKALNIKNGYPSVFYQFLANVIHSGLAGTIVPFPQTSLIAARWLKQKKLFSSLIYIDASHEGPDVYADMQAYWEVLSPGGIMFGDDFDQYWPGLVEAVKRFASEKQLLLVEDNGFWIIKKPGLGALHYNVT